MQTYHIRAVWDPEAEVYYSETNVPGLVVEAETLSEFMAITEELLPEMLKANSSTEIGTYRRPEKVDIGFTA